MLCEHNFQRDCWRVELLYLSVQASQEQQKAVLNIRKLYLYFDYFQLYVCGFEWTRPVLLKNNASAIPGKSSVAGMPKGEVIRATNCCNLQRSIGTLQVEKRYWSYYHLPQTLSNDNPLSRNKICCCNLKKFVEKNRRQFNSMQHAASTCNNEILLRVNVWGAW